jgi:alkanesulfonate monooxygenase SsuD/methylene tetrahydromethanopterin reductase-like flavin-dependent oxidoreductase (luciferase family)
MRYAFADFINPGNGAIAAEYRKQFTPEREIAAPIIAVAGWVICAETDEEAQRLASSSRMSMTLLRRGQLIPVPPPEKAVKFLASEGRSSSDGIPGRRAIIGTPEKVRAALEELAEEYGADEVIVVTITHDHGARRRSYELIAEAFGLEPAADLTPARSAAL